MKNGWPVGGEIDILEGANALPKPYGTAWNATGNITRPSNNKTVRNVASLHTSDNCQLNTGAYQTGQFGSSTCSAYLNGNMGCGSILGGNTTFGVNSFGNDVNDVGGGWYALWRDFAG